MVISVAMLRRLNAARHLYVDLIVCADRALQLLANSKTVKHRRHGNRISDRTREWQRPGRRGRRGDVT